jgi:Cu(I)/Ag(I) efflux system membrane protein CusA/SilA
MSMAGLPVSCGALVDAAIVVVEQTHKKLEICQRSGGPFRYEEVILAAVKEVAGPTFFALLVMAAAFSPLLVLEGEEGKLFRPLALTNIPAMLAAAVLTLTLDPALRLLLIRRPLALGSTENRLQGFLRQVLGGKIRAEETHPITGPLMRLYDPLVRWILRWKIPVIVAAAALVVLTRPVFWMIGSEFMPPLEEGSLLFMPTGIPGISIAQAQTLLQAADRILKTFPEVNHVLGKTGRADTATDPAPLSMLESVIVLKPHSQWRNSRTWYSSWAPSWMLPVLRHITPDEIAQETLISEMNDALRIPGMSNYWTMPIGGRIEMLTTGIRTPVGLKIQGSDINQIQQLGRQVQAALASVPGTRSVFAERSALIGLVVLFHIYYYFSSSVSFFEIPDRRWDLTQLVTPVDDRCHLTGLHEVAQDGQVLFVQFRQNHAELLAHERRQHQGLDRSRQEPEPIAGAGRADHDEDALGIQDALVFQQRVGPDVVQNQVVVLCALGEILPGVVNDVIRAD